MPRSFSKSEKIVARFIFLMKNLLYSILYLICNLISQEEISVLVYHSIDSNNAFHAINPKEFKRQMDYLRKNYRIVSLDEIEKFVKKKKNLHNKSVAITFDDGYYDNYLNVYPYLRKHKLSATIFVTTGYIGKKMLLDNIPLRMLGWNEIKEMSQNEICIGAHTIRHPNLQKMDLEEAKKEILGSKEEIERKIGRVANYFAYPFDEHNDKIVDLIKSLGFQAAFNGNGLIRQGDDPYVLNRVSIDSSVNFLMFKARLTKALQWYRYIEKNAKQIISKFSFLSTVDRIYRDTELANPF